MSRYGFLQAGGGSKRFGSDKAMVELAGKTMLQRTAELLSGVCDEVSIVAAHGKYTNLSWPVISDRWPGEGPLGGILTALSTIRSAEANKSWALILSCDMPFLNREFLAYLCERASVSRNQVVVPESASGLEPLCACWNINAYSTVRAGFDGGVRKVSDAMRRLSMEVLDEPVWKRFDSEGRLFWNMNTPDDYEAARRILKQGKNE